MGEVMSRPNSWPLGCKRPEIKENTDFSAPKLQRMLCADQRCAGGICQELLCHLCELFECVNFIFFPKASPMLGFSFSCWNRVGAIRKRRICGRYCYVTMLCVELLGRSCGGEGDCCYRGMWSCWGLATVLMLFAAVGGRCCGDEAADDAVTLLFAAVGGIDVRERECGDESADDAVAMLFAAVGGGCWGARLRRRICGRCCYPAICSCWG